MKKSNVFSSAKIMLPKDTPLDKWAVIACDQFTSEPEYWEKAEKITRGYRSALDLILPEAYLETDKAFEKTERINRAMNEIKESDFDVFKGFVFVERTLSDGKVRKGVVGMIDLEEYDYTVGSHSAVRSTEATVLSRIPPRREIRKKALYEIPHVMLFVPADCQIIEHAEKLSDNLDAVYDFELMLGGGRIRGYKIDGRSSEDLTEKITEYESSRNGLLYAVGDGNHSLAAAKSHYEEIKKQIGAEAFDHPSRYALCEIVSIGDDSIQFEPIYRIVKNCDVDDLFAQLSDICAKEGKQEVSCVSANKEFKTYFSVPSHPLTVGSLQNFIDGYLKEHPRASCDYIHGKNELLDLSNEDGNAGFIFDGIKKDELFGYVDKNGPYPRKTFSMGDAKSKRYYLEMRKIV